MKRFLIAAALIGAAAVPRTARAQQSMTGYTAADAARERQLEAAVIAVPSPRAAELESNALSRVTHVAGSPQQAVTRDYVLKQMKSWGIPTETRTYQVFMPHPTSVSVARVSPSPRQFALAEPPVAGDPSSRGAQYLTVNGYSGQGDVTADVVYANYGLIEDYAQLDSMGVSVKGKVVIARYGRSYRGIKAREAEKHGAAGLLIYSDPQDDGYVRGDTFPVGPMRNSHGVQRGSILNPDGDPSTPGYPSNPGVPRLSENQMDISHIPVVPISYGNAAELLRYLEGGAIPQSWQGGLPFRYHVGPGPVRARVAVHDDRATKPYKPIYDTFGIVKGSEFPDELVIIGGHRDAWGPGAADNVSGSVSVLQAAHAVAEQMKTGWRPKRTIIFATWDAEEWGLLGSTEFVEDDSLRLRNEAVAYFNQDVAAQGSQFNGSGSPSLREMLRDVARSVPDPDGKGSVYDEWRRRAGVADGAEPAMGDPGGGSDFAGFYNHLGIPLLDWGFGGAGGVYHSQYDDSLWMARFGDPGFVYHAAAARIGAALALRIANADVLPYDYAEYARTVRTYVAAIDSAIARHHWSASTSELTSALDRMDQQAAAFAAARDKALAAGASPGSLARANRALMQVERAMTRPQGLRTRPWFRGLLYVADENNGYANMPLPSVNEAIRAGDASLTAGEIHDLATHVQAAAAALSAATDALSAG
jgi:N-acetylated-alpha-linked acidic dipeptidase